MAPLPDQQRLWWWLLQHESQHLETLTIVVALHRQQAGRYLLSEPAINGHPQNGNRPALPASEVPKTPMAFMPGADIRVGYDGVDAIDNEQPPLIVQVKPFLYGCASRHPGAISRFYGGWRLSYSRSVVLPGMAWRCKADVDRPLLRVG